MTGTMRSLPIAIRWRIALHEFVALYGCVSREADLERLTAWARRKHLADPRRLYESRLADEQARLARYRWRSPGLVEVACWLYTFKQALWPSPRYPKRGSAAKYRYAR
jgi:hypothetical protein